MKNDIYIIEGAIHMISDNTTQSSEDIEEYFELAKHSYSLGKYGTLHKKETENNGN